MIPSNEIQHLLEGKKAIVITSHKSPDGDAVGSILGWFHILKNKGHNVTMILPDAFPEFLKWMPGSNQILYFDQNTEKVIASIEKADLLFCLDYNDFSRVGELGMHLKAANCAKVLIDHHPQPSNDFDVSYSDVSASSTCEMVAELTLAMNFDHFLDKDAASCLYTGIITDTGSFRYSSTSTKTHTIVAYLFGKGIEAAQIHNWIYDTNSFERLKLVGYALSEKLVVLKELKTAYIVLTNSELKRYNYRKGDTEGLVNYGLSISGVDIAVIFVEHESDVRISFRSFGNIPINEFAKAYFNGGGHKNAAGGRSTESLELCVEKFINYLPEFVKAYVH